MKATMSSDVQIKKLTVEDAPETWIECWHGSIQPDLVELHYVRTNGRITAVHARIEGDWITPGPAFGERQDDNYNSWSSGWPPWLMQLAVEHHPDRSSR